MNTFDLDTGFSIELINWRLVLKGKHNKLPLYESIGGEVTAIAIVKKPAIGIKAKGIKETNHIIGPIMIPDQKIFRKVGLNGITEDCYWFFSSETIKKLQSNFNGVIKIGH
jgi:hypothetical protein